MQVHAAAAKAAIDSVTRTLALEWGTYNIRVNGIAPGPIADTAGMTKLAPGRAQFACLYLLPCSPPSSMCTHSSLHRSASCSRLSHGGAGADQRMMEEMIGAHVPLGRMGTKWDVAMAAVFLCCEGATYVTHVHV